MYLTAYEPDLEVVLHRVREQAFAAHGYYWPDDDALSDSWETQWPATIEEVVAAGDRNESGTHSILDIDTIIGPDDPDTLGALRPLTAAEAGRFFGSATPTREQFDHGYDNRYTNGLHQLGQRWCGYCIVLYDGGQPTTIAVWGYSGD